MFPSGTYLQIGANTMDNPNDPFLVHLGKYNHHRKVFMEPIPAYFQKLKQNLASMPNTTFINAAISSTQGDQICSFRREHITKLLPNAMVESVEVESLTVRQMLQQHDISDVLVVLIDTEGFDWQVVRQLPLHHASFRPVLIVFEHQHLSAGDLAAAVDFLHGHGYAIVHDSKTLNTFALAMS
ncbi:g11207 [Coccomyxa elongata]